MSWSEPGPGGPRGYHHGNLKEALIRAALELIAQKGSAGFTFAEAARWAGVSPAAPYRHFRDRDELLANVARRGFEAFEQTLARAWDNGRPGPRTAPRRLGKAYRLRRKELADDSAMFEEGLCRRSGLEGGERAFGHSAQCGRSRSLACRCRRARPAPTIAPTPGCRRTASPRCSARRRAPAASG